MPKIIYSQLVELAVPANTTGGQRFPFLDQPQLREKKIVAIETYTSSDMTVNTSGVAVITDAILKTSYLTLFLVRSGAGKASIGEQIKDFPMVSLHRVQTVTTAPFVRQIYELGDYIVNWDKSVVTTGTGITTVPPLSYLFNVYYTDLTS